MSGRFLGVLGVGLCLLLGSAGTAFAADPKKAGTVRDEDTLEDIDIVVQVPKPEAAIFTPKMKTRYEGVTYEKSFLKDILDSVNQGSF